MQFVEVPWAFLHCPSLLASTRLLESGDRHCTAISDTGIGTGPSSYLIRTFHTPEIYQKQNILSSAIRQKSWKTHQTETAASWQGFAELSSWLLCFQLRGPFDHKTDAGKIPGSFPSHWSHEHQHAKLLPVGSTLSIWVRGIRDARSHRGVVAESVLRVAQVEEEAAVNDAGRVRLDASFQQRHRLLVVGVRRLQDETHVHQGEPVLCIAVQHLCGTWAKSLMLI